MSESVDHTQESGIGVSETLHSQMEDHLEALILCHLLCFHGDMVTMLK